ncbi:MAG: cytochrome c1, partial [Nevskia sp.]|nr:cytochrome c1 [Nevskia sp.]
MKRLTFVAACLLGLSLIPSLSRADEGPATLQFREDVGNLPSVQRGARDFMAYCSGCHAMKYLRYNRLGKDAGIPDDLLKSKLMLGTDKPGDPIPTAMPAKQAEAWFGRTPPDLTLETKARGSAWVYSYLQSFY